VEPIHHRPHLFQHCFQKNVLNVHAYASSGFAVDEMDEAAKVGSVVCGRVALGCGCHPLE